MDNARSDIAMRIITRMTHKRNDFISFCEALPHDEFVAFRDSVKQFLTDVVKYIHSPSKVTSIITRIKQYYHFKRKKKFFKQQTNEKQKKKN